MSRPVVPLLLTGAAQVRSLFKAATGDAQRTSAWRSTTAERLGEIRLGSAPDIGPALHTEA